MRCKYPYFHSILLTFIFQIVTFPIWAQVSPFPAIEQKLKIFSNQVMAGSEDFVRISNSDSLLNEFSRVLTIPGSFEFPFDSLKTVSRLTSEDKHFRIISWAIPKTDGSYEYSGLIQINSKKKGLKVIKLTDRSDELQGAENQILLPKNWYGALYYRIIPIQDKHSSTFSL